MCVEAEFPLDSLGPDLPGFSSRGSFKPVQPSLAWSVGNAPDFDNGENLGPCAPTCSEACTHLQQYLQTRPASPRHTCAATCTHACLHLVRPTGVNTRMCTSRDCQYPPDTCHPSGTKSQPTGPTQRDMKQTGSPGLHASRRLVSTQVRATHTAAGCDTGSHCAARHRGTMRACFLQLPTALPSSPGPGSPAGWGLGAQPPVSEDWGYSPEDMFRMRTSWGTPG